MEFDITIAPNARDDMSDERRLIERARRDRDAFATLYRQHYSAIARYLHRRVGDTHAADDLTSEVFLAALRGLPRFRYRRIPIRAWFYRIATNSANRWARRRRRAAIREWQAATEAFRLAGGGVSHSGTSNFDPNPEAGRGAVARESHAADASGLTGDTVRSALLTLSPKHQAVLALYYLEGLSIVDVAATLGCREGTVKSRLSRGRDALRERLEQWRTSS